MSKLYRISETNTIYTLQELIQIATSKSVYVDSKYIRSTGENKEMIKFEINVNDSSWDVSEFTFLKSLKNLTDSTSEYYKKEYIKIKMQKLLEKINFGRQVDFNIFCKENNITDSLEKLKSLVKMFDFKNVYVFE